ncbi:hypothetical protein KAT36_02605 [Candidatus Pacearchaeota archaeon]|nr:hypothetical protein [Candidatus Pacearchaeota archaeon]
MCFTPYISLSTFVIEFVLAIFFLAKNPKDNLNRIISLISFLLGVYQLNEFFICVTDISLFTKFAMMTTTILPALAISYALIIFRKKIKIYWHMLIYIPSIFFILMFALSNYFKQSAICATVFIEYPAMGLLGKFFGLYYILYLVVAIILFYLASFKAKSKHERTLSVLGVMGIFISTLPTFIFLLFLPALHIKFPSVLCEFALLLAIEFIIVLWYKDKHKLHY